ncbi:MAG: hypothetical protein H6861_05870 [Rhodospirillales bacterium]|nr:hypothetical protein [Rhodospirillales bacterium]
MGKVSGYYHILGVGGVTQDASGRVVPATSDNIEQYFQQPFPDESPHFEDKGFAISVPSDPMFHDDGFAITPPSAADSQEFKACAEYAKQHGLTAVLVQPRQDVDANGRLSGMTTLRDDAPIVVYLDLNGNEVNPKDAPGYGPLSGIDADFLGQFFNGVSLPSYSTNDTVVDSYFTRGQLGSGAEDYNPAIFMYNMGVQAGDIKLGEPHIVTVDDKSYLVRQDEGEMEVAPLYGQDFPAIEDALRELKQHATLADVVGKPTEHFGEANHQSSDTSLAIEIELPKSIKEALASILELKTPTVNVALDTMKLT